MAEIKEMIDFRQLSEQEARESYPELWHTARHHFPELSEDRLALIVSMATGVCSACHAAGSGCQCWNDE